MEEMPSLNKLVQRLKVPILPLELPCSGPVTHSGEILTTGKSHGKKLERLTLYIMHYTGCFTTCGHYCKRWFRRFLWSKISYKHLSDFWRLRSYGHFFKSRTRPRVNRVLQNQLAGDVLILVAYRLRKLQRSTRAVHNRTAVCVAAVGGIFENQL